VRVTDTAVTYTSAFRIHSFQRIHPCHEREMNLARLHLRSSDLIDIRWVNPQRLVSLWNGENV
jgi:hypothetical protein